MATPERESRKLLCFCGKQHGTFTRQGLDIKCRHCPETTTVPYGINSSTAWSKPRRSWSDVERKGVAGGYGLRAVPKSRHPDVRKSGH